MNDLVFGRCARLVVAGYLFATASLPLAQAALTTEPESCSSRPCTYTIRCAQGVCTAAEVAEVQSAINAAELGDTIRLEAGKTFPVTASPYALQLKGGKTGTGYITITTTEAERLPDADTRITPDYAPLLPTVRADAAPVSAITAAAGPVPGPARHYKLIGLRITNHPARDISRGLLQLGNPTGYRDTFKADPERNSIAMKNTYLPDANAVVFLYTTGTLPRGLAADTPYYMRRDNRDIYLALKPGGPPVDIENEGDGEHTYIEEGLTSPDMQPSDIIVDRCIITGTYDRQIRAGIALHGSQLTVRNSFIERIQALGVDTQGIGGHNGTGPFIIENNYIDGVTENIMFGGARGLAPDNPPADTRGVTSADALIRFNYVPKIPERYKWEPWSAGLYVDMGKLVYSSAGRARGYIAQNAGTTGNVEPVWPEVIGETVTDGEITWRAYSRNGSHFVVKNNFELKKGERMLIEHNVFDRMWKDGQESAVNLKSQDQPGTCTGKNDPTCYSGRLEKIVFRNNIVRSAPMGFKVSHQGVVSSELHIINNLFVNIDPAANGGGSDWQAAITGFPSTGLVIDHNTIVSKNAGGAIGMDLSGNQEHTPVILRNNIFSRGKAGMKGSGRAEGTPSFEFYLCAKAQCEDEKTGRNVIVGADRRKYPNGTFNACENDAGCDPSYERVGFRKPESEDYGLRDDSPFRGQATDATDIGVDMSRLAQIRDLQVTPSGTQAVFEWSVTEPIREIPCVLQISTQRNLSQPIADVNPALFVRADSDRARNAANDKSPTRRFTAGTDSDDRAADGTAYSRRLQPDTKYYYRLMCGGDANWFLHDNRPMSVSTAHPPSRASVSTARRKPRVLLIAPSPAITGGQGVQASRLLRELREEGIEVDFLPLDAVPVSLRRIRYVRTLLNGLYFYSQMLWLVPRYDILHVFSASYWSYTLWSMPPVMLGRLLGKKTIINYRSGEADDHLANWRSAVPTLRWADVLVAPSTYLVDVFGRFDLRMRQIFNILDANRFRFRQRRRVRPVFFTNRGLEPLYNVGCVIRAFHLVQQKYPDAELTVAHEGSCRAELEKQVQDLGLRNVHFAGRVSQDRMPDFYDAADIYMMSPDLDCMPGTVLECFASGIPLISTNAGGIPYIVDNGRTGLLVNCNDHEAMAECALRLLSDGELAATLTENARRELSRYDGGSIRKQWAELYDELARAR